MIIDKDRDKRLRRYDFKYGGKFEGNKKRYPRHWATSPSEEYVINVNKGYALGFTSEAQELSTGHLQMFKIEKNKLIFVRHLSLSNENGYQKIAWIDNERVVGRRELGELNLLNINDSVEVMIDSNVHFFHVDIDNGSLLYAKLDTIFSLDLGSLQVLNKIPIYGKVNDIEIDRQKDKMLICSSDGSVQYRHFESGELIARFYTIKLDHEVVITADNYYMSDQEGLEGIGFRVGEKIFPPEQFDLKYNRPDLVLSRLECQDTVLMNAYYLAYQKRLKKMGFDEETLSEDFHLPTIDVANKNELPAIAENSEVTVSISAVDSKYNLDRINVWVNDVAIYGTQGISLRSENKKEINKDIVVELSRGVNKVQLSVLNAVGAESYKETFDIECKAGKETPDLYIVTIGVSEYQDDRYNLKYAAKDAIDMVETFKNNSFYQNIYSKTITNEDVVKENLADLKEFLFESDINDQVIVFVAGHGVLDENFDYYFASHDMDFQKPAVRGIAYEELENLLDGIKPLKKLLFMDTCHSGEVDKDEIQLSTEDSEEENEDIVFRKVGATVENKENKLGIQNTSELMKSMFTDLRKGTGSTVISSSGGVEFAMESEEWKNGLFTYCLISGLTEGKAYLNSDKEITVSELQTYIRSEVTELSGGRQTPTSRIVNYTLNYRIW